MRVLVLGCGLRPKKSTGTVEYVNLDKYALPGVDIQFDLDMIGHDGTMYLYTDALGLPFDRVEAEDVLEHVEDIVAVVNDLWRILKPGGTLWVRGPDARYPEQAWADPTHKRLFARRSFDGWDRRTYDGRYYGHYFHQGRFFFQVTERREHNKGLEFTLIKETT